MYGARQGILTPALYPASFSTPCVTPIFWGKPSFGSSRRTCQIRLICEWDFGLTCLTDPHRLEKILPFQTPRKSGPNRLVWERRAVTLPSRQKPHTGPHRWDSGGDRVLPAVDLLGLFSFESIPKSPFLCLCGTVFAQGDPLIEYSNNVLQNVIRVP